MKASSRTRLTYLLCPSTHPLPGANGNLLTFRRLINSFSPPPSPPPPAFTFTFFQLLAGWKFCTNLLPAIQFVILLYKRFMGQNFVPSKNNNNARERAGAQKYKNKYHSVLQGDLYKQSSRCPNHLSAVSQEFLPRVVPMSGSVDSPEQKELAFPFVFVQRLRR